MQAIMDAAAAAARLATRFAAPTGESRVRAVAAALAAAALAGIVPAQAQRASLPPMRQVIVIGEGSAHEAPDSARITSGVTAKAKTAKEATEANSKLMAAVTAALSGAGIAARDIQTTRFSLQPIYAESHNETKLTGFAVSNQVSVIVRQIGRIGPILDRLVAAGATDIGGVQFLHSNPAKALDRARLAAMADARRKAELYAQASGLTLGAVNWISEEPGINPPAPMFAMRAAAPAAVPIAPGEDTMAVRITVGFDMTH